MKVLLGGGVDLVGGIVFEKLKTDKKRHFFVFLLKKLVGNFSSFSWISDFLWSMATLSKPFFWLARGGALLCGWQGACHGTKVAKVVDTRLPPQAHVASPKASKGRKASNPRMTLGAEGGNEVAAGILSSTCRLGKKGVPNPFPIWVLDKIRYLYDQSSIERVVVLPSQQNR